MTLERMWVALGMFGVHGYRVWKRAESLAALSLTLHVRGLQILALADGQDQLLQALQRRKQS